MKKSTLIIFSCVLIFSIALSFLLSGILPDSTSDISSTSSGREISDSTTSLFHSDGFDSQTSDIITSHNNAADSDSSSGKSSQSSTADKSSSSSRLPSSVGSLPSKSSIPSSSQEEVPVISLPKEVRAVWFSFLEFQAMGNARSSEKEFRKYVDNSFKKIKAYKLNTVIVHVRSHADAYYKTDMFPLSYYLSVNKIQGDKLSYDPLEVIMELAANHKLRVEAWFNPYRVKSSTTAYQLSSSSPAIKWMNNPQKSHYVLKDSKGDLFFNPNEEEVRKYIIDSIKEVVQKYKVDGVQFDDYFFPTSDSGFDSVSYNKYKADGGKLSLADYRRDNVNKLIKGCYTAIKSVNKKCLFGISPVADVSTNYNQKYADVLKWVKEDGYIDYICPQIYFGFNNQSKPFEKTAAEWNNHVKGTGTRLFIGLANYKAGTEDNYAGAGKHEWIENSDIIKRQILCLRKQSNVTGFACFRLDYMYSTPQQQRETDNMLTVLD